MAITRWSLLGGKVVRQAADLEQPVDGRGGMPQHQAASGIGCALVRLDDDSQATGIHELDSPDVEDDVPVAGWKLGQLQGESGRGMGIEFAGQGEPSVMCRDVETCCSFGHGPAG